MGSSYGISSSAGIWSCWKVFQYMISTELPWSISTFFTAKFSSSMVMTTGSSWLGSTPWKSESLKVIGGILLLGPLQMAWTDRTALRCFFLEEEEHPPPAKPPDMVFIVPLKGGLSSGRLSPRGGSSLLRSEFVPLLGSCLDSLGSFLASSLRGMFLCGHLSGWVLGFPSVMFLT